MNNKITFIIALLIFSTIQAQTTFDWDPTTSAPVDNGDNVTQTLNGVTTTFTISGFNSVGLINGAAQDGSSGNVVSSSIDNSELATPSTNIVFSFNKAVDITSIATLTGPPNTFTFTPTGGTNSAVTKSGFGGGIVALNWTGVTSFVVTATNAQYIVGFDNLILIESTLSTTNNNFDVVSIYPNPVTDFLYFTNIRSVKSARVYNSLGQLVTETKSKSIDFRNFNPGVYILQINTDNKTINKRIIKK